jgi:hypothetical protein
MATFVGHVEVARLLVESSANIQADICTWVPSDYASGSGQSQALEVQREYRRDISSADAFELLINTT